MATGADPPSRAPGSARQQVRLRRGTAPKMRSPVPTLRSTARRPQAAIASKA